MNTKLMVLWFRICHYIVHLLRLYGRHQYDDFMVYTTWGPFFLDENMEEQEAVLVLWSRRIWSTYREREWKGRHGWSIRRHTWLFQYIIENEHDDLEYVVVHFESMSRGGQLVYAALAAMGDD